MQNTSPPIFSLITVTRNNLSGLKKTQASLLSQTYRDFEWIIIDGQSTDGTPEHLKTLTLNEPLFTISEPDAGLYDAMNKGLKKSTGQYVLFLNSGDTLAQNETLEILTKACATDADFIYGDALENDGKKTNYKRANSAKKIIWGMFTHHQSMLYKRNLIAKNKLRYRQIYSIAADYDFTSRFLKLCRKSVHIPIPICNFELGGISQQNAFEGRRQQYIIRETLDIIPQPLNLLVFILQTCTWTLRTYAPPLYFALKFLIRLVAPLAKTATSHKTKTKRDSAQD